MNTNVNEQSNAIKDAKQLYCSYRAAATRDQKKLNLDRLWKVLECIRDDGSSDYSLAEVGRRLEKLGGPKTQSLRNAQGLHFRTIISAYASAMEGSTRYVPKHRSNVEQALEMISDISARATLRVAIDEAKRLKTVNDNLHAAFKNIQIHSFARTPTSNPRTAGNQSDTVPTSEYVTLSPRLVLALKKGISVERLNERGLHINIDGSIQNSHGDNIFPPAFAYAIEEILKISKN